MRVLHRSKTNLYDEHSTCLATFSQLPGEALAQTEKRVDEIVRAVNAHDELVRVCQETDQFLAVFLTRGNYTNDDREKFMGWYKRVQSALAKAAPAERKI